MFSFKFALARFRHGLKAKNRHGLHSPFVYRLVDEVIYDFSEKKVYQQIQKNRTPAKKLDATDKLLYRIVADALPAEVWVMGKYAPADLAILQAAAPAVQVKENTGAVKLKETPVPCVIFIDAQRNPQTSIDHFNRILPKANDGTLIIVRNIHQNMFAKAVWDVMRSHQKITASVDLFYMGLLYIRHGQVKEDFWIKF
jgi:hypothetical protein